MRVADASKWGALKKITPNSLVSKTTTWSLHGPLKMVGHYPK